MYLSHRWERFCFSFHKIFEKTWNYQWMVKRKLIISTLSILNGSIEKAWATRKTAAERTIIRETMIDDDDGSKGLSEQDRTVIYIAFCSRWQSLSHVFCELFDCFDRVHLISLLLGAERKKGKQRSKSGVLEYFWFMSKFAFWQRNKGKLRSKPLSISALITNNLDRTFIVVFLIKTSHIFFLSINEKNKRSKR